MDLAEAFFFGRGAPCQVDVTPFTHRSLLDLLGERSYRIHFFLNVLVRPVTAGDAVPPPSAPGVTVRQVEPSDVDTWAVTVSRGFGDERAGEPGYPLISRATAGGEAVTCFATDVGGEAAGGGAMEIHGGLAGFMSTSVLPAYRNRGAQTALLRARLTAAFAAGCDVANVQTTPGGASQRNVQRLGFAVGYTKLTMIRDCP
jgi:GNAT superfamily N-acetyltransferase